MIGKLRLIERTPSEPRKSGIEIDADDSVGIGGSATREVAGKDVEVSRKDVENVAGKNVENDAGDSK